MPPQAQPQITPTGTAPTARRLPVAEPTAPRPTVPRRVGGALGALLALLWLVPALAPAALAHTPEEKSFYLQSRLVLQLNPSDVQAGNAVGVWHLEYNELPQSQEAFERVLGHSPGHPLTVIGLALLQEARGNTTAALRLADAVGAAQPGSVPPEFAPFVALVRGRLRFKSGDFSRAETLLTAAVAGAANRHDPYYWLGRVRETAGDNPGAEAFYTLAIAADPYWIAPYSRLSVIYRGQGREAEARDVLARIVALENPSPYPNNDVLELWRQAMRPEQ